MSLCKKLVTPEGYHLGYRFTIRGTIHIDVCTQEDFPYDALLTLSRGIDGKWRSQDEGIYDILEVTDLGLELVEILQSYNFKWLTGDSLLIEVERSYDLSRRKLLYGLMEFLIKSNDKVYTISGLDGTGKTVLLYQAMHELILRGVSPGRVVYICCPINRVRVVHFNLMLEALINCEGIDYLFIDDIWGKVKVPSGNHRVKMVLASSRVSSLVGIESKGVNTNFVYYPDFKKSYQIANMEDYVKAWGTMDKDLLEGGLSELRGLVALVVSLGVVEDIESTFDRRTPDEKYPVMWKLWRDCKYLATKVHNALRRLFIVDLEYDLSQGFFDAGFGLLPGFEEFKQRLSSTIAMDLSEVDTPDISEELFNFLSQNGYLINKFYLCPVAIKAAIEAYYLFDLKTKLGNLIQGLNIGVSEDDFERVAINVLQYRVLKDTIYIHLTKTDVDFTRSFYGGACGNIEPLLTAKTHKLPGVDFIMDGQLYRIVNSYNMSMSFFRGLMRKDALDQENPTGINVLYYNKLMSFSMSPQQLYKDLIAASKKWVSEDKDLELEAELSQASADMYNVKFINVGEFIESF